MPFPRTPELREQMLRLSFKALQFDGSDRHVQVVVYDASIFPLYTLSIASPLEPHRE